MRFTIIPLLSALAMAGGPCAAQVYGDADGNGSVTLADVSTVLGMASGLADITTQARHYADVAPMHNAATGSFGDGRLGLGDALRIARRVAGLEPEPWPARAGAYMLEIGNSYVTRKYDAGGAATTGPGTSVPDITTTVDRVVQETVSGVTYNAYVLVSSEGSEQHLAPSTYKSDLTGSAEAAVVATQGIMSGTFTTFTPPMAMLVEPLQAGSKWSGTTTPSALGSAATYTGEITGPETVVTPAGTFTNAWKVTLKYKYTIVIFQGTGEEYVWLVPFVGPVQHGYTHAPPLSAVKTVNPDMKLVSASVHGVQWP
jgi:hypothetical protein